jgi:hypothetical protein
VKRFICALVLALLPVAAQAAQGAPGYLDPQRVISAPLTAACSGGTCPAASAVVFVMATGNEYCTAQLSGTFSGTLSFEQSVDGATWSPAFLVANSGGAAVSSATAAFYGTISEQATTYFRVRMSAFSSGSALTSIYCAPSVKSYGAQ